MNIFASYHCITFILVFLFTSAGFSNYSIHNPVSFEQITNEVEESTTQVESQFADEFGDNTFVADHTITATMGGNVADSNLDGLGDNHNDLPGATPGLISAGVDGSGGPGSNGTKRMQFEWPLESISSAIINSATVILHTYKGSVDILDTYFYHGTTDQDGILSNSDFEAPAVHIPGVVMPVSTAGTFAFDVTNYLQSDVTAGNNFFSVQGRVDEGLIGTGFKRGLQVRSTATSNSSELMPQLVVTYCYALTRNHTGSGSNPSASPTNSPSCPPGYYAAETSINLTASPSSGWHVGSWSGTENDSSTSVSNTVSMPASDHTATAHYVEDSPTCYVLTRTHTGSGADPSAAPTNSAGCPSGQYTAGASINLTASPSSGWYVASWSGTEDNSSISDSNTVSMPAGAHEVTVNYEETILNLPLVLKN